MKSFLDALNKSWEEVSKTLNVRKKQIIYFGKKIEIDINTKSFIPDVEIKEKVLILHYLLKNIQEGMDDDKENEFITFKELKEGTFYYPSIYSRIYLPVIEKFGKTPKVFTEKGMIIGGEKISDFSIKFKIFPNVYFIFELIPEDEEFPADLKILFNKTASKIFEIEDLAIIGEVIISKIME